MPLISDVIIVVRPLFIIDIKTLTRGTYVTKNV